MNASHGNIQHILRTTALIGLSCLFPVASQPVSVPQSNVPCNWLQEVKRTNTWLERDQSARKVFGMLHRDKLQGKPVSEQQLADASKNAEEVDKTLQAELDDLVNRCGWPTTSGFGDKAPQYAALIVQHADLPYQERYVPLMQAAVDAGELAPRHLALLVDRILVRKGLPQRYGSQLTQKDGKLVVSPVEEPADLAALDARRASVSMIPTSFCVYLATFVPRPSSELCKHLE